MRIINKNKIYFKCISSIQEQKNKQSQLKNNNKTKIN